ncbi:endonuclease NucS domain-containing protein [[Eubacterium] cellulosolvens]
MRKTDIVLKLNLYFSNNQPYDKEIIKFRKKLEGLHRRWNIETKIVDSSTLEESALDRLKQDIRGTAPQVRGKVVSSKNFVLPLSRTKNLNFQNTPILVIYDEKGLALDVYPHLLGTSYVGIENVLDKMNKVGPSDYLSRRGILEDPIVKIISDDPSIIGEGMVFVASNVHVSSGVIDILLRDEGGSIVVVEVETKATDYAVGQVCRLAVGYAADNKIGVETVRKIIVSRNLEGGIKDSAEGAGVELYRLLCAKEV